jgi:hypothetical protein
MGRLVRRFGAEPAPREGGGHATTRAVVSAASGALGLFAQQTLDPALGKSAVASAMPPAD